MQFDVFDSDVLPLKIKQAWLKPIGNNEWIHWEVLEDKESHDMQTINCWMSIQSKDNPRDQLVSFIDLNNEVPFNVSAKQARLYAAFR